MRATASAQVAVFFVGIRDEEVLCHSATAEYARRPAVCVD